VVGKILEKDTYAYGFDAQSEEYGNLVSKGIIDPTKVVRSALQGAASVAGLLITTEAMVAELPKKKAPPAPTEAFSHPPEITPQRPTAWLAQKRRRKLSLCKVAQISGNQAEF
jgi:hypothetical protein